MSLPSIITPDSEERRLGCTVPLRFLASHETVADRFKNDMLTLDQIKAELAGKPSMWNRRERFKGKKYIRNQGRFGSCNGFSTAAIMSRIRELRGEPYVCLSGADAYSQMNDGNDNGSTLERGIIVCKNGIAPESMVPWDKIYTNQIPQAAKEARKQFSGIASFAVDTEEELATALLMGQMGVVAVHATNAFNSEDGDGLNNGGNGVGNHSTGVQDIRLGRTGNIQFDQLNSWDTTWCSEGYTWLEWNKHFRETVRNHRFWILVSTSDDAKDQSNPPDIDG